MEIEFRNGPAHGQRHTFKVAPEPLLAVRVPVLMPGGLGHVDYMDSGLRCDDGTPIWQPVTTKYDT